MPVKDTSRISRLTAMLTQLQTKRLVTATEMAERFGVSVRTVYRDIRSLEEAGIPIAVEEGRGYSLLEGYRLPPVMFTEAEANALITAEQLVTRNKDASFVKEYKEAVTKIRSVLLHNTKTKAELLSQRVVFRQNPASDRTSNYLSELQQALTNFNVTRIHYQSLTDNSFTQRDVEPFAMYHTQENWLLIAWCRLRKEYRAFRLDRIRKMEIQNTRFKPHPLTLEQYFEICREKSLTNP